MVSPKTAIGFVDAEKHVHNPIDSKNLQKPLLHHLPDE